MCLMRGREGKCLYLLSFFQAGLIYILDVNTPVFIARFMWQQQELWQLKEHVDKMKKR